MTILKSVLLVIVRNWGASLLTIMVSRHWVTPDQQNQITVWFNGWLDVALSTLLAAAVPILFGIYSKMKDKLKLKIALDLKPGATEEQVKKIVDNAPLSAKLTANPDKI